MNSNSFSKKRIFLLLFIVLLLGILVMGGTYAALSLTFNLSITNNVYQDTTECFDIVYDAGEDIRGILFPSSTPDKGLSGFITLGIHDDCNVMGLGDLNLTVSEDSDKNGILTQVVDAHCENPNTLQTLKDYTDSSSCSTNQGIWVENGTALKYAVFKDSETVPVSVGYIDGVGKTINIYDDFEITTVNQYTIRVWLDGNLSDNSYSNISFSSQISSSVTQVEDDS